MKTLLILLACGCTGVATAAEIQSRFAVDGMSCASCPYIVKTSIARVAGVRAVEVSLQNGAALVTYDDARTGPQAIAAAASAQGFPTKPLPEHE